MRILKMFVAAAIPFALLGCPDAAKPDPAADAGAKPTTATTASAGGSAAAPAKSGGW
jgi:hypothetical protein